MLAYAPQLQILTKKKVRHESPALLRRPLRLVSHAIKGGW
jgi:hypothetical protein